MLAVAACGIVTMQQSAKYKCNKLYVMVDTMLHAIRNLGWC